jgi:hypothetical protein
MVKVRKADPALMDKAGPRTHKLSPAALVREQQQRQFKRLIGQLKGPQQVFEVRLEATEKPITIRQRLLRVAADANVEIAVRKHGDGFLVGLLTPERRTNRGRRQGAQTAKG